MGEAKRRGNREQRLAQAKAGGEFSLSKMEEWVNLPVDEDLFLFCSNLYTAGAQMSMTMDKSGANLAALQAINAERETLIKVRQVKYLNNIVEQDHRAIKRRTRPMIGFKDFRCARIILSGIETMHMIRKGQMKDSGVTRTAADQFYALVA